MFSVTIAFMINLGYFSNINFKNCRYCIDSTVIFYKLNEKHVYHQLKSAEIRFYSINFQDWDFDPDVISWRT